MWKVPGRNGTSASRGRYLGAVVVYATHNNPIMITASRLLLEGANVEPRGIIRVRNKFQAR